jgi:hypothetical protein
MKSRHPLLAEVLGEIRMDSPEDQLKFAADLDFIAEIIRQQNGVLKSKPKIPRGFVLVNLSTWQQEEMRNLARESGQQLRSVLRQSLTDVLSRLKDHVRVQRLTGLKPWDQRRLFYSGSSQN